MPDVEFFRKSDDKPLHFNDEEKRFEWRQYTRDSWYVRVSNPNVKSVFVWVAGKKFYLEKCFSEGCFTLSLDKNTDVQEDIAEWVKVVTGEQPNPGGWVALLDLWSSDGSEPKPLDPPLYIEPGNLEDEDFDKIIKQLQMLARFRHSPTQVKQEVRGSHTEGGRDNIEDVLLVQAADKFLALIRQVHSDWLLIQAMPSSETLLLPKVVDASSASASYSSRVVAKIAQHPYARRVEVLMPQESFVTAENKFLVHVLQEVRQEAPLLDRKLLARSEELKGKWEEGQDKARLALADKLAALAGTITKAAKETALYVDTPFLREVRDLPAFPNRPTDRLTRSFNYSPIYFAFCDFRSQPGVSLDPLRPGVMKALETQAIHRACTLYELWVFIELYEMLIRTFGFLPPANSKTQHPCDYVDLEAGEIVGNALKNQEFCLELRPSNNPQRVITISLWYDTDRRTKAGSRLRPDLFIKMKDSSQPNKTKSFAVDAKYRSYPGHYYRKERILHNVDTVFNLDLLITAKKKYHEGLQCDAAFVVHSDKNARFTYWGGNPYEGNKSVWPGHQYGAVFASPSNPNNLRRLLTCFLMYHMDIENICWSCGAEVESTEGVLIGRIGRQYNCPRCVRSWMRTWCRRNGTHKVYKVGGDSFHTRNDKGHMICPVCGDGNTAPNNLGSRATWRKPEWR